MDIWRLGEHLLGEGDCTNHANIAQLREEMYTLADCCLTDPPYGQIYAKWDKVDFSFIPTLEQMLRSSATVVSFCILPYGFQLNEAMIKNNWQFRTGFIWLKSGASFLVSKQLPLTNHEHMFVYSRKNILPSQLTFNGYEAGEQAEPWGDKSDRASWSRMTYHCRKFMERRGRPDGRRWIKSVLPAKQKFHLAMSERTEHPTQKPLDLACKIVELLTKKGEVVYDPFLGSGTNLLACEMVGRKCVAIEREPEYVKMAIERWERLTGKKAVLLKDKRELTDWASSQGEEINLD